MASSLLSQIPQIPGTSSLRIAIPAYLSLFGAGAVLLNVLSQLLFKSSKHPPVVFHWLPFFGSMFAFGANPIKFLSNAQKKYGDIFTYIMFGRRVTVCLSPDGNNFVFNGKANLVSAAEAYKGMTTPVFGHDVVFDAPTPIFMEQKRFIKAGLSTENFRKHVPMIVEETVEYFKRLNKPSGLTDISKNMGELIINTASRCLMGKEIRASLDEEVAKLYYDLDMGFQPINFLFPYLPLPTYWRRDKAQKKMTQLYSKILRRRKETGDFSNNDLLQTLMGSNYKDGTPLPEHHIAHMLIAVLFGGQHTSATTMSWTVLELARHPDLVRELREEQIKVLGSLNEPIDFDVLKDLTLHEAVIREILRQHPPIFQMMRKIMSPVVYEKSGHVVPKGDYVCAVPGVTQLDPTYFNNPMEFNPHRWINKEDAVHSLEVGADANEDYGFGTVGVSGRSPFLPFGAGRHRCIGEQFGYLQLKTILAMFVRMFDVEFAPGTRFPDPDYASMVVTPQKPALVKYTWRD